MASKAAKRAYAIGRSAVTPKSTAMQALGGVIAYFVHSIASENIEFVRNKWWSGPAVLIVGGHLIKKRKGLREIGSALIGAGGYAGAYGYKLNKSAQANTPRETSGVLQPSDVQGMSGSELSDTTYTDEAPALSAYSDVGYDDADVTEAAAL